MRMATSRALAAVLSGNTGRRPVAMQSRKDTISCAQRIDRIEAALSSICNRRNVHDGGPLPLRTWSAPSAAVDGQVGVGLEDAQLALALHADGGCALTRDRSVLESQAGVGDVISRDR